MKFRQLSQLFKGKQGIFFELLVEQSEKTLQGINALEIFMKDADDKSAGEVERLEREADEVRRTLIEQLNRNFVTPIDREDIFALSGAIDDILDYGYSTVNEMVIFKVKPNDFLRRMVAILIRATDEIHLATLQLGKDPRDVLEHATKAKKLENKTESLYREALSMLFKDTNDIAEVICVLKMREVYRHLSNAADRADEAANVLSNIAVKII